MWFLLFVMALAGAQNIPISPGSQIPLLSLPHIATPNGLQFHFGNSQQQPLILQINPASFSGFQNTLEPVPATVEDQTSTIKPTLDGVLEESRLNNLASSLNQTIYFLQALQASLQTKEIPFPEFMDMIKGENLTQLSDMVDQMNQMSQGIMEALLEEEKPTTPEDLEPPATPEIQESSTQQVSSTPEASSETPEQEIPEDFQILTAPAEEASTPKPEVELKDVQTPQEENEVPQEPVNGPNSEISIQPSIELAFDEAQSASFDAPLVNQIAPSQPPTEEEDQTEAQEEPSEESTPEVPALKLIDSNLTGSDSRDVQTVSELPEDSLDLGEDEPQLSPQNVKELIFLVNKLIGRQQFRPQGLQFVPSGIPPSQPIKFIPQQTQFTPQQSLIYSPYHTHEFRTFAPIPQQLNNNQGWAPPSKSQYQFFPRGVGWSAPRSSGFRSTRGGLIKFPARNTQFRSAKF